MWRYIQGTGDICKPTGEVLANGYSGHWDGTAPAGGANDHRNRSADQALRDLGPIPLGTYTIGPEFDDRGGKGPVVMPLTPDPANQMFGRSGFLIHGDLAPPHSGEASKGCVILNRIARQTMSASNNRMLIVV